MWDAKADGYARGEGVAVVVLKTLSAALEDGDHIECLIKETGVNQDGRTNGITMPSSTAQTALIRATYANVGLDPEKKEDRCQFFEAHGKFCSQGIRIGCRTTPANKHCQEREHRRVTPWRQPPSAMPFSLQGEKKTIDFMSVLSRRWSAIQKERQG